MRARLLTITLLLASAASAALAPGDHRFELRHGGRVRSYLVHIPPQVRAGRALPVVLSFHGGGGSAGHQRTHTGMNALAAEKGFIVVYPNGTGRREERLLTWNAGTCCGYASDNNVDDVGFTRAVVADLGRRTGLDRARIYATGMSNGAMMSYRLAVEAPDLVAAIAPVAGSIALETFHPSVAIPILHIHSVDDPRAHYQGGLTLPTPLSRRGVTHQPVEPVLQKWSRYEGCAEAPIVTARRAGADRTDDEGLTATKIVRAGCRGGSEIVLWKLTGSGHVWPGAPRPRSERLAGRATSLIDANREIWDFVSRFHK